jgi:hypothetical protein
MDQILSQWDMAITAAVEGTASVLQSSKFASKLLLLAFTFQY